MNHTSLAQRRGGAENEADGNYAPDSSLLYCDEPAVRGILWRSADEFFEVVDVRDQVGKWHLRSKPVGTKQAGGYNGYMVATGEASNSRTKSPSSSAPRRLCARILHCGPQDEAE